MENEESRIKYTEPKQMKECTHVCIRTVRNLLEIVDATNENIDVYPRISNSDLRFSSTVSTFNVLN